MRNLFWWMAALVLLNSCASEYVNVYITSTPKKVFVTIDSTNLSGYTPIGFHVKRSSKNLVLTAKHDTMVRKFVVPSQSFHYGEEANKHPEWWYYSSPVDINLLEAPKPSNFTIPVGNQENQYTNLYIISHPEGAFISIDSTNLSGDAPIGFQVKRSAKDLTIIAKYDTMTRKVVVKSYLDNSIFSLLSSNLYTYPSPVTINFVDDYKAFDFDDWFMYEPNRKGDLFAEFSIPNIHHFWQNRGAGYGHSYGLFGVATEIGYYYKDGKFVSAGFGAISNFSGPHYMYDEYIGEYESSYGLYVDINSGFDIKRFSFSYGFSYGRYSYYESRRENLYPLYREITIYDIYENKLGLSFSAKYKLSNMFHLGVKYIPSYVDINRRSDSYYSHMLFLNFIANLDFHLLKKKKK